MRNYSGILWVGLSTVCLTILLTFWTGIFVTALITSFSAVASFVQVYYRMPVTRNPSLIPWMILSIIFLTILIMAFNIVGLFVAAFGIIAGFTQLFLDVPLKTFLLGNTPSTQLTQPLLPVSPVSPAPQPQSLPLGLRLVWWMSWIIWNIIALITFSHTTDWPVWIITSNLVLFLVWGGVMAQQSGEVRAGVNSNLAIGIPTTTCTGVLCEVVYELRYLNGGPYMLNAIIGLIIAIIIWSIVLLVLSAVLGSISIIVGGVIGKGVHLLQQLVDTGA